MRPDDPTEPTGAMAALRRWRSARQAAVRQYGEGSAADRAALLAVKRFRKWLAKHGGRQPAGAR
jgi:hypothetical protein